MKQKLNSLTERLRDLEDTKDFALGEKNKLIEDNKIAQAEKKALAKKLEQINESTKAKKSVIKQKLEEVNKQNLAIQAELDKKKKDLAGYLKKVEDRYAHVEKLEAAQTKVSATPEVPKEAEKPAQPSQSEAQAPAKTGVEIGQAEALLASGDFQKAAEMALGQAKYWKGKMDSVKERCLQRLEKMMKLEGDFKASLAGASS